MAQQTYVPGRVILIAVSIPVTGLAKGTMIEIDYDSDAFTDEVAADGTVIRILSSDARATMKFSTSMQSPSNPALSAAAISDRLTGAVTGPSSVTNPSSPGPTGDIAAASSSWIKKMPKKTYATENSNIEWEVRCANLALQIGTPIAI